MYKTTISGTVNTRQDEHQFDDASSARKSLDMGQDVHQPTFEDGVQTGVTIIPYHAVDVAGFAYSTTSMPDPEDANCNEGGEDCKTIFDGTVTLQAYDGWLEGAIALDEGLVAGSTVHVTLNGTTYTGTAEEDGYLNITNGDSYVGIYDGGLFSCSTDYGVAGENTVTVVQCPNEDCETLYDDDVTFSYDEDEGAMAGMFNMTGAFTAGLTVNVRLAGEGAASGIIEDHDGMLGTTLSVGGNVVGAIFTVDGVTTIDMQGGPGEPVTIPVKVEQCSSGGGGCDIRVNPMPIEINWGEGAPPETVNVGVTGSNVTYEIGDQTIISVSGSAPNYSVTGIAFGNTTLTFSNENCTVVVPVSVFQIK